MSWGLGWKRPSEIFRLSLNYGLDEAAENGDISSINIVSSSCSTSSSSSSIVSQNQDLGFQIDLDWLASDDEDQVALRLQSQLMVALPMPKDTVVIEFRTGEEEENVHVDMKVVRRRESLRVVTLTKTAGSGQQNDGTGVLTRLLRSNIASPIPGVEAGCEHWKSITVLSLCGYGLSALPVELTHLPFLEKVYLDNNRLAILPSELVAQKMLTKDLLKSLKVLCAHKNPEVQRLALFAIGNLAFYLENLHLLVTSESLRELLLCLTVVPEPCVNKAAARALAILGENENLRLALRGR